MGDGFQYIDILIFAVIAGFLVLRLRSVLGRRTGLEQRRDVFTRAPPPASPPAPAPSSRVIEGSAQVLPSGGAPGSGIAAIKAADSGFSEQAFLSGARSAFQIIVNAFAAGDAAALQPLLSKEVYEPFAAAIAQRRNANETLQSNLVSIKSVDIVEAQLEGSTALVTVKFVSEQVNVTRDASGKVVDGDPERVVEHVDFWTFARSVRARDPNWTLIATHSP